MRFPWKMFAAPSSEQMTGEFLLCLKEMRPNCVIEPHDVNVVKVTLDRFGEFFLNLEKPLNQACKLGSQEREAREVVYRGYLESVLGEIEVDEVPLGPEDHARILPQLVYPEKLDGITELQPEAVLPLLPFYETGLLLVYVLEGEGTIRYVYGEDAAELGLDEEGLYEVALRNARELFPADEFGEQLPDEENDAVIVNLPSFHNSALLLVAPEHLSSGEELVAVLREDDTLVWSLPPWEDDWSEWQRFAAEVDGPFIDRPFLVTSEGVWLK